MILLVNVPVPVPSDVLLFSVVGFTDVDQHTPLSLTEAPPSEVTIPPDAAVVWETELAAVVVNTGTTREVVVTEISFPYAVPALLVA